MNKVTKLMIVLSMITIPAFAESELALEESELELGESEVQWEIGTGSNYGGLFGVTANYEVVENVELYGGLAILGAAVGAKYYVSNNVRLNANYGVNGYGYNSDNKLYVYSGLNVGADYIWDNGLSLGLTAALTSKLINDDGIDIGIDIGKDIDKSDDDYTQNVFISIGYRF